MRLNAARAISPDGFPVVALAAAFGHFPVVKYLFEKGADLTAVATNGTGYNALTGAIASGREEIAIWLLENGADAKQSTMDALQHALESAGVEFTNGDRPGVRLIRPAAEPFSLEAGANRQIKSSKKKGTGK